MLVFRQSREELGWSCEDVAKRLGCSRVSVFYWEQGRRAVPPKVADWIGQLAALHRAFPPPTDWRQLQTPPRQTGRTTSKIERAPITSATPFVSGLQ